ncbi:glycoside hydrolase family 16 protein [Aulographum hederae CBS 113979]|uniref:Glycoside hydrolase family 16 protein n=1 Tax=Aulographum hederae CBS 113979 TaxID=1176131 RepID=A0A6G1HEF1_9PEZI|nr:glycoside hydrolase family 16 protein [Aulographum hederae CBS 113979]
MSSPPPPPPHIPRAGPPHIRLNSGTDNILTDSSHERPSTARQPSSRSLMPQRPGTSPTPSSSTFQRGYVNPAESSELLLPPKKGRSRRFRDEESPMRSPTPSGMSSRRTSWSSEGSSRDSRNPFMSPFDDSRAPSRAGSSDDEFVNTQTVSEKYNILPSAGLLLFPEDIEKDDYLHNPDPNDKDRDCDVFSKRGVVNIGGLALITLGLLVLFIGFPILTFVQRYVDPGGNACELDPMCISDTAPALKNIRKALIDPDTPDNVKTRTTARGKRQVLVYSDEFNVDGRTFYEGDDPYWTAVDIWYGVTMDLEWYDPDAVTTENGTLAITFDAFKNHNLSYRSGMIQSWNQMCFKGGHMEASISLPGRGDTIGFWPGFWSMGNLGRPGYASTTDGMWPYSYDDVCDAGITPNQSDPTGLNYLPGMRLPACTCYGEDHPSPGKSRSAPEIDALEASVGYLDPPAGAAVGSVSQSCQVAPFDVMWRPDFDFVEVYDHSVTSMNGYQGGVYQQAISGVTNLNNNWYDGKQYQTYAFEYEPGKEGYVTWYVGKDTTWTLDHRALRENGNVGQRVIPMEPMAMIVNFGMSNGFAALNLTGLGPLMPATMRVDYIRIYQDEDDELITCDPPGYPTTDYIAKHMDAYTNPNLTQWSQTKASKWPKNTLMNGCEA